jgi:rSAM/selenodomain-associated transferase 2
MPAPISIIIPTRDAAAELPGTLESLMPGLEAGLIRELIISDGGSSDATPAIAESAGAQLITGPKGRGAQLRTGAGAARGDWFLFLHADTHLSRDWPERASDHIAAQANKAAHFRLKFRSGSGAARFIETGANLRTRIFALPYGDQGLLISRALYDETGGYPDQPLFEDVALIRKLGRKRFVPLDAEARTSFARYDRSSAFARVIRNNILLTRYIFGADPSALAAAYSRQKPGRANSSA